MTLFGCSNSLNVLQMDDLVSVLPQNGHLHGIEADVHIYSMSAPQNLRLHLRQR